MGTMRMGALAVFGALLAACGSSPTDGGGPYAPGGSTAAALVGKWKLARSTGEAKRFFLFSNDGRITVYKEDGVEVSMTGTYAADANKIAVDIIGRSNRFQGSGTYAVAGDELALTSEDEVEQVFHSVNSLPNGSDLFRSEYTGTLFEGGAVTHSKSFTVDLEIRANGTWQVVAVGSQTQNGVARPVEREITEGIEWRKVSPGRYVVKKTASSEPRYWRLLGGRALVGESNIMTRVR